MRKLFFLLLTGTVCLLADAPTVTAVLNTENQTSSAPLCPWILATIYGTGFGSSASGVTVTVGGENAYILQGTGEVTPNQMNVQLQYDLPAGSARVVVTVGGVASAPFNITLQAVAPTLAVYAQLGGAGGFIDPHGKYISSSNLASPGETLTAYPTGLGPTNPPIAAGISPSVQPTASTPTMTVGGVAAQIISSTLSSCAGLYQVNFKVPKGAQGNAPVVITIDGQSSNSVPLPGISAIVNGGSFVNTGTAATEEIVTPLSTGTADPSDGSVLYETTATPAAQVGGTPVSCFSPASLPVLRDCIRSIFKFQWASLKATRFRSAWPCPDRAPVARRWRSIPDRPRGAVALGGGTRGAEP